MWFTCPRPRVVELPRAASSRAGGAPLRRWRDWASSLPALAGGANGPSRCSPPSWASNPSRQSQIESGRGVGVPADLWFAEADALGVPFRMEFGRDPLQELEDA